MNILYTLVSFLGVIFLCIGFKNNFTRLNLTQKIGLILTFIGVVIPFFIGFINGFLS